VQIYRVTPGGSDAANLWYLENTMKLFLPLLSKAALNLMAAHRRLLTRLSVLLLASLAVVSGLSARQSEVVAHPDADKETLAALLQRVAQLEERVKKVEQLEARIKELEGHAPLASSPEVPVAPVVQAAPAVAPPTPEPEPEPMSDHGMSDRMDVSKTLMRIRGFGDISFH
jgi:cell division protein FtsB